MSNKVEFRRFLRLSYDCQEAVNELCTNLSIAMEANRSVMITSCSEGEGKSFLSLCMLGTMAKLGYRVVLLDADLRRSHIEHTCDIKFPEGNKNGLSHYLTGRAEIDEIVYETNLKNASIVPVGRTVRHSLALLNSLRMKKLVKELAKAFDCVIIDAPPVGVIVDAVEIAKSCDSAVFVVKQGETNSRMLFSARNQIERAGCEVLGAILNEVDFNDVESAYYLNKSGYMYSDEYSRNR